jgi:hypothetical protein
MFASIGRYRPHSGSMDELARRVDGGFAEYGMAGGSVAELMRSVDDIFADEITALDGFVAYHVLDCRGGEVLSVRVLRDQATARETDEMAVRQ